MADETVKEKEYHHWECWECGGDLLEADAEIFNNYVTVGSYCDNPKCKRYKLLVV